MILNMVGGGGGSSTKSTIIVSIDTGSTVGIYDSTYTTLIKSASEKSTGEYWLTGLSDGTYYIKATKGSDEATRAYTISEYGVYRIAMAYFEATITATFPASCTSVTLTNGIDSYSVPSASLANGTYTFTVESAGTYTGEAICNGYTMLADDVVLTVAGQSATTKFKLWLYNGSLGEGGETGANVCYSLTGGYAYQPSGTYNGISSSLTFDSDNMALRPYNTSALRAQNTIDVTPFSTLCVEAKHTGSTHKFGVSTSGTGESFDASVTAPTVNVQEIMSCDIAAITGSRYIKNTQNNISFFLYIYHMWLE